MIDLLLSSRSLPGAPALAQAAQQFGWRVLVVDENPHITLGGKPVFYGGTDQALAIAARFGLALLEPPFDLLARLPPQFRCRNVEFARFGDLCGLKAPTFVKPADALNKAFDPGIYSAVQNIRAPAGVDSRCPVLLAEPVDWSAEYRCFILEGELAAWSPYISFGRPVWKPFGKGTLADQAPPSLPAFCKRMFARSDSMFPPVFVMDVGLIDERGWAVVEFNPVWCSGLLGADPRRVLPVLERACQDVRTLAPADRRSVNSRTRS